MIIGLIPARYDSTRLPGKPLLKFGDKTMIQMVMKERVDLYTLIKHMLLQMMIELKII